MRSDIPVIIISGDEPSVELGLRELGQMFPFPKVVGVVPSSLNHIKVVQPCVQATMVNPRPKKKRKMFRV